MVVKTKIGKAQISGWKTRDTLSLLPSQGIPLIMAAPVCLLQCTKSQKIAHSCPLEKGALNQVNIGMKQLT